MTDSYSSNFIILDVTLITLRVIVSYINKLDFINVVCDSFFSPLRFTLLEFRLSVKINGNVN
jgi:hypothetical protein